MKIAYGSTNYMNFGNIRPQNTLQKKVNAIIQDINQRTDVQLENKKREEHNMLAQGMSELPAKMEAKETTLPNIPSETMRTQGTCVEEWKRLEGWKKQLADTASMLDTLKGYATIIVKHEYKAASHTSAPEAEKTYWNDTLQGLKEQLDKSFEELEVHLQERYNTQLTSAQIKETLGIGAFADMNSKEIIDSLNNAQKTLNTYSFCNIKNRDLLSGILNLKSQMVIPLKFEYDVISKIDGYLEYGDISILDDEHYVHSTVPIPNKETAPKFYLSDILGMEPGQWLNTQA